MTYVCRTHALYRLLACIVAISALSSAPAHAADGFDVRELLQRSGTRALAVEFYATWCKPCMKSLPEWKRLFEQYADDGFRLVVVSTMDPEGQCQPIGFTPTEFVCDPEGRIADAFGIKPGQGGGLPAAFLWSWQGELLVRGGHVDAVRKKLPEALRSFPTVAVDAGKAPGMDAESLAQLIRAELSADGRFQVEPSKATLKKLKGYLKRSQTDPRYSEKSRCELGMQVSPNTLVKASVIAGRLTVGAYSVESGCQIGSGSSRWSAKRSAVAVRQAVDDLLSTLVRKRPEMPSGTAPSRTAQVKELVLDTAPTSGRAVVEFTSVPPGAVVRVDGELLCQDTGTTCRRALAPGVHNVQMEKEGYQSRQEEITLEDGQSVSWTLDRRMGRIELISVDAQGNVVPASVYIDGEEVGDTPYRAAIGVGKHRVEVTHETQGVARSNINILEGRLKTETVTLDRGLSVELSVEHWMKKGGCPPNIHHFLCRNGKVSSYDIGMEVLVSLLPPFPHIVVYDADVPGLYTGYVLTKTLSLGIAITGAVMMDQTPFKSTEWSVALSGVVLGTVLYFTTGPIFMPVMAKEARRKRLREHFEKQLGQRSGADEVAPIAFSVAPLIMPNSNGQTLYGVSGAMRF